MRSIKLLSYIFYLSVLFNFPCDVFAQTQLLRSVISNGGVNITSDSMRVMATVGQPVVGIAINENTQSQVGFWYQNIDMVTSIHTADDVIPEEFRLDQNYPNPFNPSTTIQFGLPVNSRVSLTLYDILGRKVTTLIDEELQAGNHDVILNASGLPSGLYFYRLRTNSFVKTKKLTLLK